MTGGQWKSTLPGFLAPVKLLSKLFRMEFERILTEQCERAELPPAADLRRQFVCDVEAVGDGVATLKYLSRYVYRTAITNDRIESIDNGHVVFRWRKTGEQRDRRMRLPVFEFLRRFLQHVLPKRLHTIRHYGLLSRRSQTDLNTVREAILQSLAGVEPDLELDDWTAPILHRRPDDGPTCPVCHHPLTFECFIRIRPPPLEIRGFSFERPTAPRFETIQNRGR